MDARLLPARRVALRLVDARGSPAARTLLRFRDLEGSPLEIGSAGVWTTAVTTDERGEVEAGGLPADVVRVIVPFGEGDEEELEIDLRPEPQGALELRLGRSLPGPRVETPAILGGEW